SRSRLFARLAGSSAQSGLPVVRIAKPCPGGTGRSGRVQLAEPLSTRVPSRPALTSTQYIAVPPCTITAPCRPFSSAGRFFGGTVSATSPSSTVTHAAPSCGRVLSSTEENAPSVTVPAPFASSNRTGVVAALRRHAGALLPSAPTSAEDSTPTA